MNKAMALCVIFLVSMAYAKNSEENLQKKESVNHSSLNSITPLLQFMYKFWHQPSDISQVWEALPESYKSSEILQEKQLAIFLSQGQWKKALEFLERPFFIERRKTEEKIALAYFLVLEKLGDNERALKESLQFLQKISFNKDKKLAQQGEESLLFCLSLLVKNKKMQQAQQLLKEQKHKISLSKDTPHLILAQGYLTSSSSQDEKLGIEELWKAYNLNPQNPQLLAVLSQLLYQKGKLEKADDILTTFLSQATSPYPDLLVQLISSLWHQKKYEQALPFLQDLVLLDPEVSNKELWLKYAVLILDKGQVNKAHSVAKTILEKYPREEMALAVLSQTLAFENQLEKSFQILEKISLNSPVFISTVSNFLELVLRSEKILQNQQIFLNFWEKLKERHSLEKKSFPLAWNIYLANYWESIKNNPEKALILLKSYQFEKEFGQNERYYLALLKTKMGQRKQAYGEIERILKENPDHFQSLNFLGHSYLVFENAPQKAFPFLARAVKINPEYAPALDSLGWYYYKTKDFKKALVYLEKALIWGPQNPEIQKHLALAYFQIKNFKKAKSLYEELQKICETKECFSSLDPDFSRLEAFFSSSYFSSRYPTSNPAP